MKTPANTSGSVAVDQDAKSDPYLTDGSWYQQVVKNAAGRVYKISASNMDASTTYYLKLYNKATTPNPASDTPRLRYSIPVPGREMSFPVNGDLFDAGISFVLVTGVADTDTTAVPANKCYVNVWYDKGL